MKLTPLLLLISVCAFAQQKDKPVKLSDYYDSLDQDIITWDEIFRSSGFDGPSRYADPELAKKMHEWMPSLCPYVWTDKNRPIIIDEKIYHELLSSHESFKKSYQRADSLMRVNDEQHRRLQQKLKSLQ